MKPNYSVVMLGATGAVGGHAENTLSKLPDMKKLTLLGRRKVDTLSGSAITQNIIDISEPTSYQDLLKGHQTAICALGIGQPSKFTKAEFIKIDKDAVLDFAKACKAAGIQHFELLSAIGATSKSASFYLRIKGELEDGLKALNFNRLSLFHPSMILTPTNRYGLSQQIVLKTWPILTPFFMGPLRKIRGIKVDILGAAIAKNITTDRQGVETLYWDEFRDLARL
ncbi:MAG: hypothetical protein ACI9BD_000160 [Candidatus Marinamargulisbacteria bacterium]|jgi:uncharacterized protein YbjT (DUF2867 family)